MRHLRGCVMTINERIEKAVGDLFLNKSCPHSLQSYYDMLWETVLKADDLTVSEVYELMLMRECYA